jgi:hypothetical protein
VPIALKQLGTRLAARSGGFQGWMLIQMVDYLISEPNFGLPACPNTTVHDCFSLSAR